MALRVKLPGRTVDFSDEKCPRCGKNFEALFKGQYCKECTDLIRRANRLEAQLNRTDFSFDREDEEIARQIGAVLIKEDSVITKEEEEALNHLLQRRIAEEGRRIRILQQLKKIQQEKAG